MLLRAILIFGSLLISVSTVPHNERKTFGADYVLLESVNLFVKEHSTQKDWLTALLKCEDEGAELFVPTSKAEIDAVLNFNGIRQKHEYTWLGIQDQFTEGSFMTYTGKTLSDVFINWRIGEPNNVGGENCGVLSSTDGTFIDVSCGRSFPFVCSKKKENDECAKAVYGFDGRAVFRTDYILVPSINAYLKYHVAQNWHEAVAACLIEDATLFIPKTDAELNAIISRMQSGDQYMWIGVHDLFKEGTFVTLEGQPIHKVYNGWKASDPNNYLDKENCVFMDAGKFLYDADCGRKHSYVCFKKTVSSKCRGTVGSNDNPIFRSDYTFVEKGNLYLKEHKSLSTWMQALATCQAEGSNLFAPTSEAQIDVVLNFNNIRDRYDYSWLGIHDQFTEGIFMTYEGTPLTKIYSNWRNGEPNNAGVENCGMLASDGTFIDTSCGEKLPYVCSKNKEISHCKNFVYGSNGKPIFRSDYEFVRKINSYLKYHTGQSWQDAVSTCLAEGATLFIPKTNDELDAVFSRKKSSDNYLWIGVHDIYEEGNFITLEGQTLDQVYHAWKAPDPNNALGKENCVFMDVSRMLLDADCIRVHSYFCLKKAAPPACKTISGERPLFRSDYKFVESVNLYFKEHDSPKKWIDALLTCDAEDSELFVPTSKSQIDALLDFNDIRNKYDYTWLGIQDHFKEGSFMTYSGMLLNEIYSNWRSGEPNNAGIENCGMLATDGTFIDTSCSWLLPYVCCKRGKKICNNETTGFINKITLGSDYTFVENINGYLKYHPAQKWQDAVNTCITEGSTLFIPKTDAELNALISRKQSDDSYLWIGIHDLYEEGNFVTLEGQPLVKVYHEWKYPDPNNALGKENCVFMDASKSLLDADCDRMHSYFCLKYARETACEPQIETSTIPPEQPSIDHAIFRNDYVFFESVKLYLKEHKTASTWLQALTTCETEGSKLFEPKSKAEVETVLNLNNIRTRYNNIWLGIHDHFTKGTFVTYAGTPLSEIYSSWKYGEPNNEGNNKHCVMLISDGKFSDSNCKTLLPYVCSKEEVNLTEIIYRNDFVFVDNLNSYIKYHRKQTWTDAVSTCLSEEATLFIPKTETEMSEIISRKQNDDTYVWIGIHDTFEEGNFFTLEGQLIEKVYNKWTNGDPNNYNGNEHCVCASSDKTLLDLHCSTALSFFCRKEIDMSACNQKVDYSLLDIRMGGEKRFRDDYTYIASLGSFIKHHTTYSSWGNAVAACLREGTSLFVPKTESQVDTIIEYKDNCFANNSIWLGLKDLLSTNTFMTLGGQTTAELFNEWAPGKPSTSSPKEDCVALSRFGFLSNEICDEMRTFVCSINEVDVTWNKDCNTNDMGYALSSETNSCHKVHSLGKTWREASKICIDEQSHLAIINSPGEANVYVDLFAKYPAASMNFITSQYVIHMGFYDVTGNSMFLTVKGKTLSQSGYEIWAETYPYVTSPQECGGINRDGKLVNFNCSVIAMFICEKDL